MKRWWWWICIYRAVYMWEKSWKRWISTWNGAGSASTLAITIKTITVSSKTKIESTPAKQNVNLCSVEINCSLCCADCSPCVFSALRIVVVNSSLGAFLTAVITVREVWNFERVLLCFFGHTPGWIWQYYNRDSITHVFILYWS